MSNIVGNYSRRRAVVPIRSGRRVLACAAARAVDGVENGSESGNPDGVPPAGRGGGAGGSGVGSVGSAGSARGGVNGGSGRGRSLPWGDAVLSAVAGVGWAVVGMGGTAALGLHLVGADARGSLGALTAAVVALAVGGSVSPSVDVSAFGMTGAEAHVAFQATPLGVSLVGAVVLGFFFLRSLRGVGGAGAGAGSWRELVLRAGVLVVLFGSAVLGISWVGRGVVRLDGGDLGLRRVAGGGGWLGGLVSDRVGDLARAEVAVRFVVDLVPTVLGGVGWCIGVLVVALLASRRTSLPAGWEPVRRVVRPAVSAVVTVLLVAVGAGVAAAGYAAVGDDHPGRVVGAALLGAPNGAWLAVPLGLFVPWDGRAGGVLRMVLPHPVDQFLTGSPGRAVTVGRLAELDGRVWLLAVGAGLLMVGAGVLTAVRTPSGTRRIVLWCGVRLGVATGVALPVLVWLTGTSVDASLSVLGFDAFGTGVELRGRVGVAVVAGVVWGGVAGVLGGWVVGRRVGAGRSSVPGAVGGPYSPSPPYRAPNPDTNPYLRLPEVPPVSGGDDVSGAPTVASPTLPPPPRRRHRSSGASDPGPPPPPPREPGG
ncbi:streptophobe family protein [Streptomyces sp. DSM 110735]|uniref:streptophobe family protein n=1 Tax=Streptomyces sp. DSM 110735 TaxID=2775031 RepID=UPI0027DCE79A|nr:streptophobe family protein [Streptomyces sp. DSM 110735]